MHIFTVHIRPESRNPYENPVFIEERFTLWAFIFHAFWALYHRLWWVAAALIGFEIFLRLLVNQGLLSAFAASAVGLGVQLILGFHAQDLRRAHLRKQGYVTSDIVIGNNPTVAEQRFFERYFPNPGILQT